MSPIGRCIFPPSQVEDMVGALAVRVFEFYWEQYPGEPVTVLGLLSGAAPLVVDLTRRLLLPVDVKWAQVSSYVGTVRGSPKIKTDLDSLDLAGQNVLIVDDIVDSGSTMSLVRDAVVHLQKPVRSVKTCALLTRRYGTIADFVGTTLGSDDFLVGYGMDWQGLYRNLPYISVLK